MNYEYFLVFNNLIYVICGVILTWHIVSVLCILYNVLNIIKLKSIKKEKKRIRNIQQRRIITDNLQSPLIPPPYIIHLPITN